MAMSPMRTGMPAGVVLMTMSAISSGSCAWPLTRPSTSWWLRSIMPGESTMLVVRRVSSSVGTVTEVCSSLAGSGVISNSGSWPPCTTTMDTPLRRFSRGLSS